MQTRLQQEKDQVVWLDKNAKWRRGRIRDVVAANEVLIEINAMLSQALTERGATLDDLSQNPAETRDVLDGMPSFDVAVTLKTAYHRDAGHQWTVNDIHDIDALGSTVPYADIVVTDKAAAHHLHVEGVAERCRTVVLSKLSDLPLVL